MKPIEEMTVSEWISLSEERQKEYAEYWCKNIEPSVMQIYDFPHWFIK